MRGFGCEWRRGVDADKRSDTAFFFAWEKFDIMKHDGYGFDEIEA
jgi:hypothetical protein